MGDSGFPEPRSQDACAAAGPAMRRRSKAAGTFSQAADTLEGVTPGLRAFVAERRIFTDSCGDPGPRFVPGRPERTAAMRRMAGG